MIPFVESSRFQEDVTRLKRKYRHIESDLDDFKKEFLENPILRSDAIPGYERKLWKTRIKSTDQQKGKSGGFRLIFFFDEASPGKVIALTIYPKSEIQDISGPELLELYKRFIMPFINPQVLYFAYGSNMNTHQMETRVKHAALPRWVGWVGDYSLLFNKEGKDQSGKANIVLCPGGVVWGVVYQLSLEELKRLEPFEQGYDVRIVEVTIPALNQKHSVQSFVADASRPELCPTPSYLQLIIQGAQEHQLPADYCQRLRQTKSTET